MYKTFATLRENEREIRRELILNSAVELFDEYSFNEINMQKIADKTGIATASIYRFFTNRNELFMEILVKEMENIKAVINEITHGENVTIEHFVKVTIDCLLDNQNFFRMLCYFYLEGNADKDVSKKFFTNLISLKSFFEKAIEKIGGNSEPTLTIYSFFTLVAVIFMEFYNSPDIASEEKKELMYEIALSNLKNMAV